METSPTTTLDSVSVWPPRFLRLVLGAVVGSVLGWAALSNFNPIYVIPPEIAILPDPPPVKAIQELEKAQFSVDSKNFSILFAVTGALIGLCSTVAAFGLSSIKTIIASILFPALLAVPGANLSSWLFTRSRAGSGSDMIWMGITLDSMMQAMVGYAMLWSLIGLGLGLGLGCIRGVKSSMIAGISGFFGGLLAAMLFVLATAQFSPSAVMSHVFPSTTTEQIIWFVTFAAVIAATISLGSGEKKKSVKTA